MFVGAINQEVRSVLAALAPRFRGLPIYVGCSGNFTVERVLDRQGFSGFHSNDVSLYSCALGNHLTGREMTVEVAEPELRWLSRYLQPGIPAIATLVLCGEMLGHYQRREPYHRRMWDAYTGRFEAMHSATAEKVDKALEGLSVAEFHPGDVVDFMAEAPRESVAICFPPTYKGGYERLYRVMDRVFRWDSPVYQEFDEARFAELTDVMRSKAAWVTLRDEPVAEMESDHAGTVQTALRSRPVHVYSNIRDAKLAFPRQKVDPVMLPRASGEITGPLRLVKLTQAEFNGLRSQYLSTGIVPAAASAHFAVVVGGQLAGAFSASRSSFYGEWCDAYMMSDFAIRPATHPRLSKLVLAAALSREAQVALQEGLNMPVRTIGTTAFTDRAVSMKYRGLFTLTKRKEGALNYLADAGRWPLQEGLEWWMKNRGAKSKG